MLTGPHLPLGINQHREQVIERREIEEDDKCDEEEPEMMIKEISSSVTKLRRALLSWGDICICTAKMLALVEDEVSWPRGNLKYATDNSGKMVWWSCL